MAITHVASAAGATNNPSQTDTITISASVQADDILIVCVTDRYVQAATTVTDDDTGGNAWAQKGTSVDGTCQVWWKRATSGTAGKTITVDVGAAGSMVAGYSAYRGAYSGGDPITNTSFEHNILNDRVHTGFTPDFADSWLFLYVANRDNNVAISGQTCTTPGALVERWEKLSNASQDSAGSFASIEQAAGPSATGDFGWTSANWPTASGVFALRPESAGESASGGSTATVTVSSEGAGAKTVSDGATVTVSVSPSGAGVKAVSAGATASVTVSPSGAGTKQASDGSTSTVNVTTESAGTTGRSSGSTASITVTVEGAGEKSSSGGTTAGASVTTTGDGVKVGQGGSTANITVTAEGGGSSSTVISGGSTATITVTATGGGVKSVSGGSTAQILVTVESEGYSVVAGVYDRTMTGTASGPEGSFGASGANS